MNTISTPSFIDGEIIEAKVGDFITRFNKSMKETAESIIDMGITIYEASRYLGPIPLEQFCQEIRMSSNNPMFKKLKKIGENHMRLEANVTKLPNNWTTIYKLAVLTTEDFKKIVDAEVLSPCVTAKQINECLGTTKVRTTEGSQKSNSIIISVASDSSVNVAELIAKIEELKQEFHFELDVAKELETEIFISNQGRGM